MNPSLAAILRRVPEIIEGADTIPLFGNAPPFDWHHLSSILSTRFEMKDFSIHPSRQSWRSPQEIEKELGADYFCTAIHLNPLSPPFYFAIPKADQNKLTTAMMEGKTKTQISEPLKEGFCRFLVLEGLSASSAIDPISKLTPTLGEAAKIPHENAFCIDVEIAFGEVSCWSRLVIPASFRKAWIEHFSTEKPEYHTSELAKATELIVGCELGSVALSQQEWASLHPGDFVLLDRGHFDFQSNTTLAILKLGPLSLFQVRISQDKMEIIDYVTTYEETMEQEKADNPSLPPANESSVSIKDIPMNVSVELARLRITLDQLMHLHPGNMLTLPIHPDQGVFLMVNGKKVGRAELLYLGDSLGIRILELG